MILTFQTPNLAVFDDVLDDEAWSEVWTYFQYEDLEPTTRTAGAWKLADGQPLAGPDFHLPAPDASEEDLAHLDTLYPTDAPVDHVLDALAVAMEAAGNEVVREPWLHAACRAYVYPVGTGLSWHRDDHARYAGAFVYYAHPEWNVQWGGELNVAHLEDPKALPMVPYRFETRAYSTQLMEQGLGHYILAKPNRLVVLGAQPHRVAPVLPAAGDHVRASVAGFFVRHAPLDADDAQDDDA